jgi:Holliday junction resolvase
MPTYETQRDRANEERMVWQLELRGFTATLSRPATRTHRPRWDIAIRLNGEPYALAEYKFRKRQYQTLDIDKDKIDCLMATAAEHSVKPVLIIEWAGRDGPWIWNCVPGMEVGVLKRERGNRGDPPTVVYKIPINQFRKF